MTLEQLSIGTKGTEVVWHVDKLRPETPKLAQTAKINMWDLLQDSSNKCHHTVNQ